MNKGESVAKKAVEMELAWLKDRTVLAERVQRLLKQDNIAFAAELVRTAQRRHYDTQGAWNAILAYCFGKGHAEAAFRFWNDVSFVCFYVVGYVDDADCLSSADEETWRKT